MMLFKKNIHYTIFMLVWALKAQTRIDYSSNNLTVHPFNIKKIQHPTITVLSLSLGPSHGAVQVYQRILYQELLTRNIRTILLISKDSLFHEELMLRKIPHFTTNFNLIDSEFKPTIIKQIRFLCKAYKPDIIHTHAKIDTNLAVHASRGLPIKKIFTFHQEYPLGYKKLEGVDGFIAVNKDCLEKTKHNCASSGYPLKKTVHLYPLADKEKFLDFKNPPLNRADYFKKQFGLIIPDVPIICMLAQFYPPETQITSLYRKNQELLLKAATKIIHEHHKPVHIIFAGDGPSRPFHEAICKELKLENNVSFLGHCKNNQELLFYSDINILTSIGEAFGVTHLEAGLMKKPSLGATETGAEYTIAHGLTGFLFKNNDVDDLVEKLEMLIDNPGLRASMGDNGYLLATGKNYFDKTNVSFLKQENVQKLIAFYHRVIKSKP